MVDVCAEVTLYVFFLISFHFAFILRIDILNYVIQRLLHARI